MTAAFVLSLDEELAWGSRDRMSPAAWARRHPDARGVSRQLLALLDELDLPATWAVVGQLFVPGDAELLHAPDLVDAIAAARAGHEIGCHSFAHLLYDAAPRAEAEADLLACLEAARPLALTSFVFPRNREGHHDLLRERGFTAYRGEEPRAWRRLPRPARRAAHFAEQALGGPAPTVRPVERLPGLWNVPGSLMLFPRGGLRDLVPVETRVRRARATLARAIARGEIFHLWLHPFNLAVGRDAMFAALGAILRAVADERERGRVEVLTMRQVAARAARGRV